MVLTIQQKKHVINHCALKHTEVAQILLSASGSVAGSTSGGGGDQLLDAGGVPTRAPGRVQAPVKAVARRGTQRTLRPTARPVHNNVFTREP